MASDRIFGLIVLFVALAYIASATQIQTSFLSDPVGPRSFPIIVGAVATLCSLIIILRPDTSPEWPAAGRFVALGVAVVVMVAYAYALKPLGFIIPTFFAAGILSYQLSPRVLPAAATGAGLSVGLFVLFKYVLDLGLVAFPKAWFG